MRKSILIVCALLLQIAAPVWMIRERETTLRTGTEIVFPVQPIDPADAFRGRFITLGFATNLTLSAQSTDFKFSGWEKQKGWVLYRTDGNKAVSIVKVAKEPNIADEGVWIKTSLSPHYPTTTQQINIELPFRTFYLNEKIAPRAERLFQGRKWKTVEAVVRVRNGKTVLAEVLADGKPIAQAVRELSTQPKAP